MDSIHGSRGNPKSVFSENVNENLFFRFDESLIRDKKWAGLPLASKAVFPVIASHCNKDGKCAPSEERIAILAGVTPKTVRVGIKALTHLYVFRVNSKPIGQGHRLNHYHIIFPPKLRKGIAFPFHKCLIDSGRWSALNPSARALYPVMRYFGDFDLTIHEAFSETSTYGFDFKESFAEREFDLCDAKKRVLAEYAGIDRSSLRAALINLKSAGLIAHTKIPELEFNGWRVFIVPNQEIP